MVQKTAKVRERERRVIDAFASMMSGFPAAYAEKSKAIQRQAKEIERDVKEVERSIGRGARPLEKKFSL